MSRYLADTSLADVPWGDVSETILDAMDDDEYEKEGALFVRELKEETQARQDLRRSAGMTDKADKHAGEILKFLGKKASASSSSPLQTIGDALSDFGEYIIETPGALAGGASDLLGGMLRAVEDVITYPKAKKGTIPPRFNFTNSTDAPPVGGGFTRAGGTTAGGAGMGSGGGEDFKGSGLGTDENMKLFGELLRSLTKSETDKLKAKRDAALDAYREEFARRLFTIGEAANPGAVISGLTRSLVSRDMVLYRMRGAEMAQTAKNSAIRNSLRMAAPTNAGFSNTAGF